jgi:broad specificity phosphatase PhoE
VAAAARRHPGQLVVIVCHAGVVEATLISFLPLERARVGRGWIQTDHASMTEWRLADGRWMLRRYNDVTPLGEPQQA